VDIGAGDGNTATPADGAWIAPDDEPALPLAPPRGVVYGDGLAPPRSDPYQPLRAPEQQDAAAAWPMDDPSRPDAGTSSRFGPFLIGLVVGIVLAAISVAGFQLLTGGDDESQAAPTTTAPATTVAGSTETAPDPAPDSTTDTAATDPGAATQLDSSVGAPPGEIPPVGAPLAIGDLLLAADGIGPVKLGLPADQALGRLVVSFGPPDEDSGTVTATGEFGACIGEPVRVVRWGPLAIVVTGSSGSEAFTAYRLDLAYGGLDSRAAAMATLSGLRAGDTIEDLESTYVDFTIEYPETDAGLIFELHRRDDGALLLWGPVTTTEPEGKITGLYSPDACKG